MVRVEFTAAIQAAWCLLCVFAREDIGFSVLVIQGLAQYDAVLGLLSGGLSHLAALARWSPAQLAEAADALRCSGGVSVLPLMQAPPCVGSKPSRSDLQVPSRCACFWLCTCVRLVLVSRNESVLAG